jgi:hypothetical protein
MLSREIMGALALAILWVNTLLIAAAAFKQRAALVRLRDSLRDVRATKIVRGDGPGGAFAACEVKQLGRLHSAAAKAIVFFDQSYGSVLYGGSLEGPTGETTAVAPSQAARVWAADSEFRDDGASAGTSDFNAACVEAKKARGFPRTLRAPVAAGQTVFIATIASDASAEERLVATMDPRRWIETRARLALAFAFFEVAVAAACTALALHVPVFGTVSTVGGAACLAFFLLVQPLGTAVRDALRPPDRAPRRGKWTATASSGSERTVAARDA